MATAKRAETAQELKQKYQRKRMTASTAAKYQLYNYLYWAYLKNEEKPIDYTHDRVLKNDAPVIDAIVSDQNAGGDAYRLYKTYCGLCEWLNSAFSNAVLARNNLLDYLIVLRNEVHTTTETINRMHELGEKDIKKINALLDMVIYHSGTLLRNRISANLRYLNTYNTIIDIIARKIGVPELTFLQVDMKNVNIRTSYLNGAFDELCDKLKEITPDGEEQISLKAFEEVSSIAPPIPTPNILNAENSIKEVLFTPADIANWSMPITVLSAGYWRPGE